jgi:transposase-like protein
MARLKRSVHKEQVWRLLLEEQRRCGLSIRAFCRQKAISEPSFYVWRKELQQRDAPRTASGGSHGRLIPVEVIRSTGEHAAASSSSSSGDDVQRPLEIGTPSGFTLRFGHDANAETVARLLDVIARAATGTAQRFAAGAASC